MQEKIDEHWGKLYSLIDENAIDDAVMYCKELDQEEYTAIEEKLIRFLKDTEDNRLRNTVAVILGELHCNEAIPAMVSLLSEERCQNDWETLISALEDLGCANHMVEIFPILCKGKYEEKQRMYTVFVKKMPYMKEEDIAACKRMLMERIDTVEWELQLIYEAAEDLFGVDFEENEDREEEVSALEDRNNETAGI